MSTEEARPVVLCPDCGVANPVGATTCWLCHQPLVGAAVTTHVPPRPGPAARDEAMGTTGIVLGLVLLGVLAAALSVAPGLGIVVVIVLLPVFIWWIRARGRPRGGPARPSPGPEKADLFLASLGAMLLAGVAAAGTFLVTCGFGVSGVMAPAHGIDRPLPPELYLTVAALSPVLGLLALFVVYRAVKRFLSRQG